MALRLEKLCSRGVDAPPAESLERLHPLWGTADNESARRRLLSYAACGVLDGRWRLRALEIDDTEVRLAHALAGLEAHKAQLGAELALREASEELDRS